MNRYIVEESFIGFSCDNCFFDSLDDAINEVKKQIDSIKSEIAFRISIMKEFGRKEQSERWVVIDRILGIEAYSEQITVNVNGTFY